MDAPIRAIVVEAPHVLVVTSTRALLYTVEGQLLWFSILSSSPLEHCAGSVGKLELGVACDGVARVLAVSSGTVKWQWSPKSERDGRWRALQVTHNGESSWQFYGVVDGHLAVLNVPLGGGSVNVALKVFESTPKPSTILVDGSNALIVDSISASLVSMPQGDFKIQSLNIAVLFFYLSFAK